MSINAPDHYVVQYATNWQLLLQQQGSRFRDCVTVGSYSGKQASPVDQFGAVEAREVTGRFEPIGRVDGPLDRRWVYPRDFDLPQYIDSFDKLRQIIDPMAAYSQNTAAAMSRAMDDVILSAYFGDARTGEAGEGTETFGTALTTAGGQNVSVNEGGAASGFNVAKLREAKLKMQKDEVDLDRDMLYAALTPTQHDNLLDEVQIISSDFNGGDRPVLKEGKVERFLGCDFKISNRIPTGTDDTSNTSRGNPVWVKSGMHLGIWQDVVNSLDQDKTLKGHPWQLYSMMSIGATRLEKKKVIRVWSRE